MQFEAKDVAGDAAAREELIRKTGARGTPVILVGDEVVIGFNRGRLQQLLGLT